MKNKQDFQDAIQNSLPRTSQESLNDRHLFGFGILEPVSDKVRLINLDKLDPNPYQPRKTFNDSEMEELAENIHDHGLVQKITIIQQVDENFLPIKDKYFVVAGERRLRAFKILREKYPQEKKWHSIECVFDEIEGLDAEKYKHRLALVALAENLKRSDLNFVDFAEIIVKLKTEFNLTFEELGKKIGKSDNHLRMMSSILSKMGENEKEIARKENMGRDAIEKMLAAANKNESKKKLPSGDFDKKFFTDFKNRKTLEYSFDDKIKRLKEIISDYFAKNPEEQETLLNELIKK